MNSIIISDIIEVTILAALFYHCFIWLDTNKEKEHLKRILILLALGATTWTLQLKALQILLFYISTPASIIYYLIYEKQLRKNSSTAPYSQKSFSFKNPNEIQQSVEILIQEAIHGLCDEKNIVYVLEQSDPIDLLLAPSLEFNMPISKKIIQFLINSVQPTNTCSILCKNTEITGFAIPLFDSLASNSNHHDIQKALGSALIDTDIIVIIGFHLNNQWAILHKEWGYFNLTTKELFATLHHFLYVGGQDYHDYTKNNKTNSSQHSL